MLLAYLDEFGHVGPFLSVDHEKFNDHPAYGYAGFVIPASKVRKFGGEFEFLKESLLSWEIKRAKAHPRRWEKKGSALLSVVNNTKYGPEINRTLARLSKRLNVLGGKVVFWGQMKPVGLESETNESSSDRNVHALIQVVRNLCKYADKLDQDLMIFLDSVDSKPRLEAVSAIAGFIYKQSDPALGRVLEVPMQLDSKYYGTTQYADWICALISRASLFHLTDDNRFEWAPASLRAGIGDVVDRSTIQVRNEKQANLTIASLRRDDRYSHSISKPNADPTKKNFRRGIWQTVGQDNPGLRELRDSLTQPVGK